MLRKSKFVQIVGKNHCLNGSVVDSSAILHAIFAVEANEHLILERVLNFRWTEQNRISQYVEEIKAGLLSETPSKRMGRLSTSNKQIWKGREKILALVESKELDLYLQKSEHWG